MPSLLHSLAGAFVHALAGALACALAGALGASSAGAQARPFGVGRVARPAEVRARDISVAPDGTGLPRGRGSVAEGRVLYRRQCAMCHGDQGIPSGPQAAAQYPVLVGGFGTLTTPSPVQTVGSFWPYATTVWDYIHRAMPYQRPGTLRANEVYALTAYLLYLNHIVPRTAELSETTLPSIRMPNRDGFVSDPRPDVGVP
ncbi:MAG TPA: cytochrome c [Gemmatimonadaceae bacterium]